MGSQTFDGPLWLPQCVCVCGGGGGGIWNSMGTINGLVKHILQSVFFCVQQKKLNFTLKLNFK